MNRDHLLFDDPAAATVWTFVRQLTPPAQHLLLAQLREHLATAETTSSSAAREATASPCAA
ncbi:MAG: hypothetical protein JWR63_1769 [Conexibacter sp.]|nr:hypothetical protein [Conexibacter sp.]MCW2999905.1 hypothetical protein [Solirubrobacterales bacterium]